MTTVRASGPDEGSAQSGAEAPRSLTQLRQGFFLLKVAARRARSLDGLRLLQYSR